MSLQYYLYISDAKIDMLLQQIDPGFARKRVSEVGVSLKFISAKRTVEDPGSEGVAGMERVVRYVDDFCDVGTVDEPGQYVRGRLPMRWGPLGTSYVVYFAGGTERTTVGLGGSSGHVLSAAEKDSGTFAPSTVPGIIQGLPPALGEDGGAPVAAGALAAPPLATPQLPGAAPE